MATIWLDWMTAAFDHVQRRLTGRWLELLELPDSVAVMTIWSDVGQASKGPVNLSGATRPRSAAARSVGAQCEQRYVFVRGRSALNGVVEKLKVGLLGSLLVLTPAVSKHSRSTCRGQRARTPAVRRRVELVPQCGELFGPRTTRPH